MDMSFINGGRSNGMAAAAVALPSGIDAADCTSLQASVGRARRLRDLRRRMLGTEHFTGPGWEILLHLFDAYLSERRETVGNVCDGTDLPATTAIRWISRLSEDGLINLRDDHLDGRRRFVELSLTGLEAMTRYFAGIEPHQLAA